MKKNLIVLMFVLLTGSAFSNPIIEPPIISEIYWDENGWMMELLFNEMFYYFIDLNELTLVCNGDTSAFISGISIILNQPIVVTKEHLIEPFEIPIEGGCIDILTTEGLGFITFPLTYGNYQGTPVALGQSIVHQKFYIEGPDYTFWLVKETQPSIGELPFSCQTRANFSGKVVDKFLDPVPNADIKYIYEYYY